MDASRTTPARSHRFYEQQRDFRINPPVAPEAKDQFVEEVEYFDGR